MYRERPLKEIEQNYRLPSQMSSSEVSVEENKSEALGNSNLMVVLGLKGFR
jgi:hypothetical protein